MVGVGVVIPKITSINLSLAARSALYLVLSDVLNLETVWPVMAFNEQ